MLVARRPTRGSGGGGRAPLGPNSPSWPDTAAKYHDAAQTAHARVAINQCRPRDALPALAASPWPPVTGARQARASLLCGGSRSGGGEGWPAAAGGGQARPHQSSSSAPPKPRAGAGHGRSPLQRRPRRRLWEWRRRRRVDESAGAGATPRRLTATWYPPWSDLRRPSRRTTACTKFGTWASLWGRLRSGGASVRAVR